MGKRSNLTEKSEISERVLLPPSRKTLRWTGRPQKWNLSEQERVKTVPICSGKNKKRIKLTSQ